MSNETVTLDADAIGLMRNVLLLGLDAIGELERLKNAASLAELMNSAVPEGMKPRDVIGDVESIGKFATCLRLLG